MKVRLDVIRLIRKVTAATLVSSLVNLTAYGQMVDAQSRQYIQQQQLPGSGANDIVLGIINTVGSEYMKYQQQNMMNSQMSANLQSMAPQTVNAQYFPHCKLSASMTAFKPNACSSPAEGIQNLQMYQSVSSQYVTMYDQLLNPGQNSSYPVGLKCLESGKENLESDIQDMINGLTNFKTQIAKKNQQHRDELKKIKGELDDSYGVIHGDKNRKSEDLTIGLDRFFDATCQQVIGDKTLVSAAANGGLKSIFQDMQGLNSSSKSYNKGQVEADLRKQVSKMEAQIKEQGIDNWIKNADVNMSELAGLTPIAAANQALSRHLAKFDTKRKTINSELAEIVPDFKVPTMDKNFGVDMQSFANQSEEYFKKDYINDCVYKNSAGINMTTEQLLNSFNNTVVGKGGTTINNYQKEFKIIWDNEGKSIHDKMNEIKELDSRYANVVSEYNQGGKDVKNETIYTRLEKAIANCGALYSQSNINDPSNPVQVSRKKKIERANEYVKDIVNLEKNFTIAMREEIYNQVFSCNGASEQRDTCSSASAFSPSDANFCIAHADSCQKKVNKCFGAATKQLQNAEANLAANKAKYNKKVTEVVAAQEKTLALAKANFGKLQQGMKRYFSVGFELPEGLFVKMPELLKNEQGLELLAGGDLSFLDALEDEIDKISDSLRTQGVDISKKVVGYINSQADAIGKNRTKWSDLLDRCKELENQIRVQVAEKNAEGMARDQEVRGTASNVCQKYNALTEQSPLAACGGDNTPQDLYNEMSGVVNYISDESMLNTLEFNNVCAEFNNEKPSDDDENEEKEETDLWAACSDNDWNWKDTQEVILEKMTQAIPSQFAGEKDLIEEFLKGKKKASAVKKANEDLYYSPFFKKIKKIASVDSDDIETNEELAAQLVERKTSLESYLKKAEDTPKHPRYKKMIALLDQKSKVLENSTKNKKGDYCHSLYNNRIAIGALNCTDPSEKYSESCYKKESKKAKADIPSSLAGVNRSIASINDSSLNSKWAKIGERARQQPCQAPDESSRNAFANMFGQSMGEDSTWSNPGWGFGK